MLLPPLPPTYRWHRGPYRETTKKPHFLKRGFFVCYFLPCPPHRWHRGPYGRRKKTRFLKRGVFSCVTSSLARCHRGPYGQTTKKTHFLKRGFFVCYFLPCPPDRWHRGPYGQTTEKARFKNVFSWFVTSSLAPHIGDIEARMGKPRETHFLKRGFFVCYFLPCPPHRWHRGPYGQTTKKTHFLKRAFFVCYFLPCPPHRWHTGPYGQTTKKTHFLKRGFSFVTSSLAPHIGDIEARMGKPRKKHTF